MTMIELRKAVANDLLQVKENWQEWHAVCQFIGNCMTDSTICDNSNVEMSADGKHLFVSHVRTPALESFEPNAEQRLMLKFIGVPTGNLVKTDKGIIFGKAA